MASGIIEICTQVGAAVAYAEVSDARVAACLAAVDLSLQRAVERARFPEDIVRTLARIQDILWGL